MTTIKLESAVRDELAKLAKAHGRSLGEEVAALIEAKKEQDMWDAIDAGFAAMSQEEMEDYLLEQYYLLAEEPTGTNSAADEYPQYAGEPLDPAELARQVAEHRATMERAVERFGGQFPEYANEKIGDGS